MRTFVFVSMLLAGCASAPRVDDNPPMRAGGPKWEEVDKTVERVKEKGQNRGRLVETSRTQEQGFRRMTDDDYASALDSARTDVKKANPKMSDVDTEKEATKRADDAKRQYEASVHSSASSTYEWKKP